MTSMAARSGYADLPLHGGHVPAWLASRMAKLGAIVTEAIVHHYGRDEFLKRLAHPFWFQSFGSVMGMDWHSSGITTSVLGALKRGLGPLEDELGIFVCGGRGKHSRKTPNELASIGDRTGLDGESLARSSRLVAKVDSAAVQDGFALYLHGFVVTREGKWTVVQQGMRPETRTARRYHWLGEGIRSFVDDPHEAIEGENVGRIVNLADARAKKNRDASIALVESPDRLLATARKIRALPEPKQEVLPHLVMPAHHDVREDDVVVRRLRGSLAAAADRGPKDFEELLLVPGVGARTLETIAMVAEVVHGARCRFTDPARFSFALGGKDGHPFPVPLRVYDETIRVLKDAIDRAKLGQSEKLDAIRRLDDQARALDQGTTFDAHLKRERARSHTYGGRTVKGPVKKGQLDLF